MRSVSASIERKGHTATIIFFGDLRIEIDGGIDVSDERGEISSRFDVCLARPYFRPTLMNFLFSVELLRCLEGKGLPVVNSSSAFLIGANKLTQYALLTSRGLPVPRTVSSLDPRILSAYSGTKTKAIAKRICGSRGQGVFEVEDKTEFMNRKSSVMMIQEYVRGGNFDVRGFFVGHEPISWMRRVSDGIATNISRGGSAEEYLADGKVASLASEATRATQAAIAGVDIAFDLRGNPFILEVNSQPDFIGLEKVSRSDIGSSIVDLMVRIGSGEAEWIR